MEIFAGRYHLVDPIADGGMGSVWRAWDAKRGGYVAAKLLRPSDAASLLRFVREQALRVKVFASATQSVCYCKHLPPISCQGVSAAIRPCP